LSRHKAGSFFIYNNYLSVTQSRTLQKKGEFFDKKVTPKNVEISTVSAKRVKKVILFKLKKIFL